MSEIVWRQREPKVMSAGDVGGDVQTGDAWEASWWCYVVADGGWQYGVAVRYFYPAVDGQGAPVLQCQTEYLACTDATDPGTTQLDAEAGYEDLEDWEATSRAAFQAAMVAEPPTLQEWAEYMPAWEIAEV